jgi:hypothetical protein
MNAKVEGHVSRGSSLFVAAKAAELQYILTI